MEFIAMQSVCNKSGRHTQDHMMLSMKCGKLYPTHGNSHPHHSRLGAERADHGGWVHLEGGGQGLGQLITLQLLLDEVHRDGELLPVHLPIVVHVRQTPTAVNRSQIVIYTNNKNKLLRI